VVADVKKSIVYRCKMVTLTPNSSVSQLLFFRVIEVKQ